uniref:[Gln6]-mosact n=1 Tax=Clypeaster japonicus TaxID=7644 RepID=MOSQ_CLYJA|nr:RecName: Full=[Gln6]-mosact [Clypeaster japonicus]prf//1412363A mosact [Clypeaster japonicus]prf//1708180C sperm activating peptide III [Clypeaster japonicus]
DSDSAQNLIG